MLISHRFSFLYGHMVTVVTVTVFLWILVYFPRKS